MAENKKSTVDEQLAEMRELIQEQARTIETLKEGVPVVEKAPEAIVTPTEIFKVGDKKYKFLIPRYKITAEIVLASDSLKNPAELERLVSIQSGVIKLVK